MTKKTNKPFDWNKYIGIIDAPPDWSSLDPAQLWVEVERLRKENEKLVALVLFLDQLPPYDHWLKHAQKAAKETKEWLDSRENESVL